MTADELIAEPLAKLTQASKLMDDLGTSCPQKSDFQQIETLLTD